MTIDVAGPVFTNQPVSPTNQTGNNSWSWQSSGAANADQHYEYELRRSPLPGTLIESGTKNGSPVTFTGEYLSEGTYQLLVRESRNDLADWSLWVESGLLTVDTTPPVPPTLTATPVSLGRDNTPSFAWTGEPGAEYTYQITGPRTIGPASTSATAYTAPTLADGSYTFTIYGTDAAGNSGGTESATFTIDTTPPGAPIGVTSTSLTGTAPNQYVTTANTTFTWNSGGGGNGVYRHSLDGGTTWSAAAAGSSRLMSTPQAQHTLVVQERDAAGNWSLSSAPVVFLAQPLFLSRVDLNLAVGSASTGTLYVAIRRGATELGIASMDQPSNLGFSGWWPFSYGSIPVLPNELITIAAHRSDDQVLNDNYTTWWSANGPIGTNVYPYGEGTGGTDDVDMTFRTYTRTTPGGAETLDQQQTELQYGYRLFQSDRTQTFTVHAP